MFATLAANAMCLASAASFSVGAASISCFAKFAGLSPLCERFDVLLRFGRLVPKDASALSSGSGESSSKNSASSSSSSSEEGRAREGLITERLLLWARKRVLCHPR